MSLLYTLSFYFIFQISDSLPLGIYKKKPIPPTLKIGQLVLFELPTGIRAFMIDRHWIPSYVKYYLMKPVAAKTGDVIQVNAEGIFINNVYKGPVKQVDQQGHKLPHYIYTGTLQEDTYFLLSDAHNSFDSRYFGPVHKNSILSVVEPFMIFP